MASNMTPNEFHWQDANRDVGRGRIATMWCDFEFTARRAEQQRENAPAYRLFGRSPGGAEVEIGAIWERQARATGGTYLSLAIRDTGVEGREFGGTIGRRPGPNTTSDDMELAIIASKPLAREAA